MQRTLWNFEHSYGSDCLGAVRLQYDRPMHWQVWEADHEQPRRWGCLVHGDLDELNSWALGMSHDGRLDVLDSLGIALGLDPLEQFLGIRPRARLIASGRQAAVAHGVPCEGDDVQRSLVHVFAEPACGRSVAVWSVVLEGEFDGFRDCNVICSGARSMQDVVDAALRIGSDITDLYSARIEDMFQEIEYELEAMLRMVSGS